MPHDQPKSTSEAQSFSNCSIIASISSAHPSSSSPSSSSPPQSISNEPHAPSSPFIQDKYNSKASGLLLIQSNASSSSSHGLFTSVESKSQKSSSSSSHGLFTSLESSPQNHSSASEQSNISNISNNISGAKFGN